MVRKAKLRRALVVNINPYNSPFLLDIQIHTDTLIGVLLEKMSKEKVNRKKCV